MRRALCRVALAVGGAAFLCGCASFPGRSIEDPPPAHEEIRYLAEAPPVAQRAHQCGPAALESVFRYWRRGDADAGRIARSLIEEGDRGVLNFMLAQYAKGEGFWTEIHEGTPEHLRDWIRRGIPPIVMLRVGPLGMPIYHFAVVIGFNDGEKVFYVNTGGSKTRAVDYRLFLKRWKAAGAWLLILCPPEKAVWKLEPMQAADLALLLERSGKWDSARERYEQALQDMPESRPVRFNLANVYLRLGRREEAKQLYRALIEEDPGEVSYSNNLAWALLEEGSYRESIRVGEEALLRGADRRYDLLDTIGLAYCRLKEHRQGLPYLMEALRSVPPEKTEALRAIRRHLEESASAES